MSPSVLAGSHPLAQHRAEPTSDDNVRHIVDLAHKWGLGRGETRPTRSSRFDIDGFDHEHRTIADVWAIGLTRGRQ